MVAARRQSVPPVRWKKPRARAEPRKETLRYALGRSAPGHVLVAASAFGVVSVLAGTHAKRLVAELQGLFADAALCEDSAALRDVLAAAIRSIENPAVSFDYPLHMRGTPFQRRLWEAVRTIPAGKTVTYADIAAQIKAPRAMRAVGSACANSPFFMIVPCHRVLAKSEMVSGILSKAAKERRCMRLREMKELAAAGQAAARPRHQGKRGKRDSP